MANAYSMDDLLDFLTHAGDRGLMPASTAQALAVATRNVLGVLTPEEKTDIGALDMEAVIKRFMNKRAREFNPSSLKEYERRIHRAVDLYKNWKNDPANFSIKTRATVNGKKKNPKSVDDTAATGDTHGTEETPSHAEGGTYRSAFPVRPGVVVTIVNIPSDLTGNEAERLSQFIKMLVI